MMSQKDTVKLKTDKTESKKHSIQRSSACRIILIRYYIYNICILSVIGNDFLQDFIFFQQSQSAQTHPDGQASAVPDHVSDQQGL